MTSNEYLTIESIDQLKRKLISQYVFLMLFVLLIYALLFYFIFNIIFLASCTLFFGGLLLYTWLLMGRNYQIKTVVHIYMISAPLFASFIMLCFWKQSISACLWLLPIPFGAYIFFEKKYVYLYSLYTVIIIVTVTLLTELFSFNYFEVKKPPLRVSDAFIFIVNIAVLSLLLYYKDKIKKLEIEKKVMGSRASILEQNHPISLSVAHSKSDSIENIEKYTELFNKIRVIVENESKFKENDFSISNLCSILKTNSIYVSKALKQNGYNSFNQYINTCRVNHVKDLIKESDFNKMTLMYVYTASGFSNQSTFNRVFKQIEGVTPSEYIKLIMES